MTPSVVGFLFISGWFGISFKLKSVMRLLATGAYCAIVVTLLYDVLFLGNTSACAAAKQIWIYFRNGWFLWAYLALMMVGDLLEPMFERFEQQADREVVRRILPVTVLVFVWSYAATKIPVVKIWMPQVVGFSGFGVLTFLGVYVLARTCRCLQVDTRFSAKWLVVSMIASGAFCWLGFMHYHSPFAFVFAASAFFLVCRLPYGQSGLCARLIRWIAPSMFSVYLLHNNSMGMAWLQHVEDSLIGRGGWNYYLVCLMVALSFFIGGLLLDLPRRVVCMFWKGLPTVWGQTSCKRVACPSRK